jgi:hypothetical protein
MTSHRFEIGECVSVIEKRFPNGVRRTEFVVVQQLTNPVEPHYELRGSEGLALCVLAESQLSPPLPVQQELRIEAPAPDEPGADRSPWSA